MSDDATTTEGVEEALAKVPIFSRLNQRDLKKLAKLCVRKTFEEHETLIEEGATGLGLFVVTSGRVEIFKGKGEDKVVLGAMEEGDVIGEIALIDDQPRSASGVALTPTECLLLTRDSFEGLIKQAPEIAWCIVPSLSERVRELHANLVKAEDRLRQGGSESDAPETDSKSSEDEEEEDSEVWETMTRMTRMPCGLMLGGLTGVTAMAKTWETFFSKLAEETDLRDSDSLSDVIEKAPDGFVAASREALSEFENAPQDMVDSFHKIYKEE